MKKSAYLGLTSSAAFLAAEAESSRRPGTEREIGAVRRGAARIGGALGLRQASGAATAPVHHRLVGMIGSLMLAKRPLFTESRLALMCIVSPRELTRLRYCAGVISGDLQLARCRPEIIAGAAHCEN